MFAGLEVAHPLQTKVHTSVKRQLLEHVVVEAEPGVHVDTTFAGNAEPDVQQRLGRRATTTHRRTRHRRAPANAAQYVEQDVVVEFVLHADPQSAFVGAHDHAVGHQLLDQFLGTLHRDEEEVRVGLHRRQSERGQLPGESLALRHLRRDVERRRDGRECQ